MRAFLHIFLPLLVPILLYLLWVTVMRGRQAPDWWRTAPWPGILAAGFALTALSLGAWAIFGVDDREGTYIPPRVEGGIVVPSEVR